VPEDATLVRARGEVLLEGLERHLPGSRAHADGTASYAFAVAVELGAGRAGAELVRETARLHEVGMIYLPAQLLAQPRDQLNPGEATLVASHPAYGARLAAGAAVPDQACGWIGAAGERFDGAGGLGMVADEIPLEARIIRVACACDSLIATLPGPEGAWSAIAELRAAGGGELDPWAVEAAAAIIGRAAPASP
jgi:HD-GYP domain-containing protein (c-di-GMP phosphodiesterase class II)